MYYFFQSEMKILLILWSPSNLRGGFLKQYITNKLCVKRFRKKCHLHTHTRVLIFHFAYISNHVIYHFFQSCRKISCYLRHTLQTVMSTLKFELTFLGVRFLEKIMLNFQLCKKYRFLHENT